VASSRPTAPAVSTVGCDSCSNLAIIGSAAIDQLAEYTLNSFAYCQASTAPCDHPSQSCTCTNGTTTGTCTADVDGVHFACFGSDSNATCNFPECESDAECAQTPGARPARCGPLPSSGSFKCCVPRLLPVDDSDDLDDHDDRDDDVDDEHDDLQPAGEHVWQRRVLRRELLGEWPRLDLGDIFLGERALLQRSERLSPGRTVCRPDRHRV